MTKICYVPKEFRASSLSVIDTANEIIEEYQAQGFNLTLRQLYYQFVARGLIENKATEYNRLGSIINYARLAGLVDWEAIEDRTREVRETAHWTDPESIVDAVADQYRIDKWFTQPRRVEIWIEKDALVGVFEDICTELDVGLLSCRGYTSQSEMWRSAQRFIKYVEKRYDKRLPAQTLTILHFGDHDPSGIDMSRDIEDRIRLFLEHEGMGRYFEFRRLALNKDQVDEYNPPPNPAKETDSRIAGYRDAYGDESWELDALEPTVLAALVRDEVESLRDKEKWGLAVEEENNHRRLLNEISMRWDSVAEFIDRGRVEDL